MGCTKTDVIQPFGSDPASITCRIEAHVKVGALPGVRDVDKPVLINSPKTVIESRHIRAIIAYE
jgi:hypothetical protein